MPQISLGNLLLLIGMAVSVGAGVWQGGMIRATLEDGIRAERELRVAEVTSLSERMVAMSTDIREIRGLVIADRKASQ